MKKEELLELINIFGLYVELDKWDVELYGWVRVMSEQYPDDFGYKNNCIIIYKTDTKEEIINQLQSSLIDLGKRLKVTEFRDVLKL